ncbi:GATA transcription factor 11 [Euphorbia lathyris]|uniref:GATA transcription factor 11 n=1 Tax=Euphorbia lathyris TaxID=212925 RepID=UPI0033130C3E
MNSSWFFDENFNGVPDDFFDDAMKFLDFPLEDVDSNDAVEDWDAKFQHLVPPTSNVLPGFTENSNELKVKKSCSISLKQWPSTAEASSNRSIPLNYDLLEGKYLRPFWTTSSPVSVLESSSSSSSAENPAVYHPKLHIPVKRPRSKRPRPLRRTFPFISITYAPKRKESSESQSETYLDEALAKKKQQKRKNLMLLSSSIETKKPPSQQKPVEIRKCTHCEVTKTPQWREGPMGPKTLCNACGVRYRSGRLFPEYRPAASPTFVPAVHSNSHRKVIEMRKTGRHVRGPGASDGYPPLRPSESEQYSF